MQPVSIKAEINNAKSTSPAVSLGSSVGSFPQQWLVIEPTKILNATYLMQLVFYSTMTWVNRCLSHPNLFKILKINNINALQRVMLMYYSL